MTGLHFCRKKNKKQKAVEIHGIRHFIYVCIKRVSSLFFCGPADTTCASAIWADLVEVLPTYAPRDSFGNRLRLRHEKNVFNTQTVQTLRKTPIRYNRKNAVSLQDRADFASTL